MSGNRDLSIIAGCARSNAAELLKHMAKETDVRPDARVSLPRHVVDRIAHDLMMSARGIEREVARHA
jgi:hypothetical protein